MKSYYDLFVELSLQCCTKNDYTDRLKVKKHNVASKKLGKLQDEMKLNISEDTWCVLLNHEDDRVKLNAAAACLQSEILIDQAVRTLKKIIHTSYDSTIRFSAKMLLDNNTG